MTPMYKAEATSEGGREGRANLSEGGLGLAMALPKAMGGSGKGANPEQLFALGYAACFNQAILVVGGQRKADVSKAQVTADVDIGKTDAGGFGLAVELKVRIPGMDGAQAQEIVEAAHQICPYSNATRNNIPVKLTIL